LCGFRIISIRATGANLRRQGGGGGGGGGGSLERKRHFDCDINGSPWTKPRNNRLKHKIYCIIS
jgi:hypothetical protein